MIPRHRPSFGLVDPGNRSLKLKDAYLRSDLPGQIMKSRREGRTRSCSRLAQVTTGTDGWVERELAEQGHAELFSQPLATSTPEDFKPATTVGARQVTHILDLTQHRCSGYLEYFDATHHVGDGHFLWSRDHDHPRKRHQLDQRQRHTACSGRQIDDQIIKLVPLGVKQ